MHIKYGFIGLDCVFKGLDDLLLIKDFISNPSVRSRISRLRRKKKIINCNICKSQSIFSC